MKAATRWVISDGARDALKRCELFRELEPRQLMEVAALVEEISLKPDELLLGEGDSADHVFVVIEGTAVAQLELHRGWLSLGIAGPADSAGWSSLIGGHVYPASVKALTPLLVARIDAKGLALLMNLQPAIGYGVTKSLSKLFCRQYQAALEAFKTSR